MKSRFSYYIRKRFTVLKNLLPVYLFFFFFNGDAQELFTYTDPASNMAKNSVGFRLTNSFMTDKNNTHNTYMITPELMYGLSRKVMVHAETFLSNYNKPIEFNGAALYLKYRFFSRDDVHSHFRMAVYGRGAVNKNPIHQKAIDLNGFNSGYELGMVSTLLQQKTAISAGASVLYASDNRFNKFPGTDKSRWALSYYLSSGRLFLPRDYVSYNQLNLNGMLEILGQTNLYSSLTYIDIAPSLQFIILSKMRVDLGYRFPLVNNLSRIANSIVLVRFEYNLFNLKK